MGNLRTTDYSIPFVTVLMDAVAMEAAFLISYLLRTRTALFAGFGFTDASAPPLTLYLTASCLIIPIWLFLFHWRKMYRARRNVSLSEELLNIMNVVTRGMLVVLSLAFFYRSGSYSRLIFLMTWGLGILFIFTGRALIRSYERRMYRLGRHLQKAIIVGSENIADAIAQRLNGHRSFGFTILGYFAESPVAADRALAAIPYQGPIRDAGPFIQTSDIETVFVALPATAGSDLSNLVVENEGVNVEFLMVPDVVRSMTSTMRAQELDGIPFLKLKSIPLTAWGRIIKRTFDLIVAGSVLLVLFPFWILIAILIKISSPGPVFYRQERVGLDGSRFNMIKFRSMRIEAEDASGPVWTSINDPRRTTIGVFLRKTSIDEIPQLLNVLHGDMSLVGPRPERPFFVDQFKHLVPKYLDRHRVRTGMTGWAQVNGLRGDTSLEERIKYDLYYIENWSLTFDIRILFRTIHTALNVRQVH